MDDLVAQLRVMSARRVPSNDPDYLDVYEEVERVDAQLQDRKQATLDAENVLCGLKEARRNHYEPLKMALDRMVIANAIQRTGDVEYIYFGRPVSEAEVKGCEGLGDHVTQSPPVAFPPPESRAYRRMVEDMLDMDIPLDESSCEDEDTSSDEE